MTNSDLRTRPDIPPMPGDVYRHYKKGDLYEIVTCARFEMGHEIAVVYRSLANGALWIRGLNEFNDLLDDERGHKMLRFERVQP